MNQYMKRLAGWTVIILLAVALTACGSSGAGGETSAANPPEATQEPASAGEPSGEAEAPKTVVDQSGREVVIPDEINRVVMTALPFPSIYAITGEPVSKVTGMHPGSKGAIENSIMGVMYPELLDVESGFIEGTDINMEELLKLNPDVVFYWADYANQTKQFDEAGITAIGVNTQGNGDALLTLQTWLEIMGDVFGQQDQVGAVIDYGREITAAITEKVADIPEEDRQRGLFLFHHSSEEIVVPGTGHYGDYWIEGTGGINVAKEIDVTAPVNMEQIYQWNPEVIYISSFTTTVPEDLFNNTISGQDWSQVDAVKNGRVYKEPVGVYRWYPPSGDAPLMLKWMANHQYPDLFSYDMEAEVEAYYKRFYDFELTEDEVLWILNPLREAADGTSGLSRQRR
ncbi:ABC transporter substrate-binding protein [Anoxynatronum sibiricum]|uniref:ABC transporter substrate-binding protein n=1 Tax=Anoxynatronum sibiricum TaxID=210623 RepID=A0ABU9VU38_9CLOT